MQPCPLVIVIGMARQRTLVSYLPLISFFIFLRSAYFLQIEDDVQKHAKTIVEIKTALTSFQTKDMAELIKFHNHVEQHLEKLTDETQVSLISYGLSY